MDIEEPASHQPRKDTKVGPNVSTKKKNSVSVAGHQQKAKQALVHTVTHSDDPWNPWGAERVAGFQTGLLTYLELVQLYFICLM